MWARWLADDADEAEQAEIAALSLMADVNQGSGIALYPNLFSTFLLWLGRRILDVALETSVVGRWLR